MFACPASSNVPTPAAAFQASSAVTARSTVEKARMRRTAVSIPTFSGFFSPFFSLFYSTLTANLLFPPISTPQLKSHVRPLSSSVPSPNAAYLVSGCATVTTIVWTDQMSPPIAVGLALYSACCLFWVILISFKCNCPPYVSLCSPDDLWCGRVPMQRLWPLHSRSLEVWRRGWLRRCIRWTERGVW